MRILEQVRLDQLEVKGEVGQVLKEKEKGGGKAEEKSSSLYTVKLL